MYKRLEKGRFRIPTIAPGTRTAMLDATELAMLLDGIDVTRVKRPALWEPPSIAG
jgi:transposase